MSEGGSSKNNTALSQLSNIGNKHYLNGNDFIGFATAAVYSETFTDSKVETQIMSQDDDHVGILFRYQDMDNYYALILDDPADNEPTGTCLIK